MLTPQEVSSHVFSKAVLGGYNMAMVDEFLDVLTEDYIALYNDNAILKNKLKVLSDTVEEYRATDEAMRKTLLSAQQMADSMIQDAELKKANLLKDAETTAHKRIDELKALVAAEEARLRAAQESTAAYVEKVDTLFQAQELTLRELTKLGPVPERTQEAQMEEAVQDIENNLSQILDSEEQEAQEKQPAQPQPRHEPQSQPHRDREAQSQPHRDREAQSRREPAPVGGGRGDGGEIEATRRFDDLQFGKDYEIR